MAIPVRFTRESHPDFAEMRDQHFKNMNSLYRRHLYKAGMKEGEDPNEIQMAAAHTIVVALMIRVRDFEREHGEYPPVTPAHLRAKAEYAARQPERDAEIARFAREAEEKAKQQANT